MGADERDGWLRAAWRKLVAEGIDAGRLVVFGETRWARRTRRSRRSSPRRDGGAGAYAKAPRNRGEDTTLLASVTRDGVVGPCLAVVGSTTTKEAFEAYVERALASWPRPGQV